MKNIITILNVQITTDPKQEITKQVAVAIANRQKLTIFTPNPEIIALASKTPPYQELLNTADIALADGVGLKIAYFLRHPFSKIPFSIIHGVDFMLELCRKAEINSWSVGLLGGRNGAAEKTRVALLRRFPKLKVTYVYGDFEYMQQNLELRMKNLDSRFKIPNSHLDILFVALGSPKEQIWINENKETFPATVFMQVGGSFDIISGILPRAPRFLQTFGLEWLWRLFLQPKRILRQFKLIEFLMRSLLSSRV